MRILGTGRGRNEVKEIKAVAQAIYRQAAGGCAVIRRRSLAGCCAALLLMGLTACETPTASDELTSGLSEETVVEIMGEAPLSRTEFTMPDNPDTKFVVVEYRMVGQADWSPIPHWILFDRDGLVTYGEGGTRDAQVRAYEAYYDWMATHGKLKRTEAERLIRDQFRALYGQDLNPTVDSYLSYRVSVMEQVDAGKMTIQVAEQSIQDKYVELSRSPLALFAGQPASVGDDGSALGRATAVAKLGPDLTATVRNRGPRAARPPRGFCGPKAGRSLRCF